MDSWWRRTVQRLHPEGIPWPASVLYNAISSTGIFQRHYDLVADDVAQYCSVGRILDIGTGPGWLLLALRRSLPDAEIVGVDISAAMVAKARENIRRAGHAESIEMHEGSAADLPFPNEHFDAVVSTGSMHHWKEPVAGLNEIHRVLKDGGHALVYDLVRNMPDAVVEATRREFGKVRLAILWLHSFEEPFYNAEELESLAASTRFQTGHTRFVGALCCLVLQKEGRAL